MSGWSGTLSVNIAALPSQKPNLTPYQPPGASDRIVVTKTQCGGMVDDGPLYTTDTLYLAFWVINNGTASSTTNAGMSIYLDGQLIHTNVIGPLQVSQTANCCACVSIGPLSVGTHTVKIVVDTGNTIDESNESDNEYTKTIKVNVSMGSGISVVSPNGGETWTAGTTQTIRWSYTGNPGSRVKIELLKGGVVNGTIMSSVSMGRGGNGSHGWRIPSNQALGADYRIRVTSTSNSGYTDMSDNDFTVE
jgi:hypothetical protein